MTSRGQAETEKLKENLEERLERLLQQLEDLEEVKCDLDETEYEETKAETIEQLKEINESLPKMISGNMTLVDQLGSMQIAIQAAISEAFKTPAVIRMFTKREPDQLKQRLSERERDFKLGHLSQDQFIKDKKEILLALKHLGEKLTHEELNCLQDETDDERLKHFEKVTDDPDGVEKVLNKVRSLQTS